MKLNKLECDRCGYEFTRNNTTNLIRLKFLRDGNDVNGCIFFEAEQATELDLCSTCNEAFVIWWGNK